MSDVTESHIQQFNDSLQQLNRDKEFQTQIDAVGDDSFDNLSQISGSNASLASNKIQEAGSKLFNKLQGSVTNIFQEEKKF